VTGKHGVSEKFLPNANPPIYCNVFSLPVPEKALFINAVYSPVFFQFVSQAAALHDFDVFSRIIRPNPRAANQLLFSMGYRTRLKIKILLDNKHC